jgi:aldehyde:ferredoxin oxidoreductase
MNEFSFRILNVNLSNGKASTDFIESDTIRSFLGGTTLAAYLLYPYLDQSLDPLSPEAPLLFLTGPLTGTTGPAVGRFVICARSPATRLWGESNIGGFFGPELRKSGFDGLMITGKLSSPGYLWIKDGNFEILEAEHLWNRTDTYEIQEVIREELGSRKARICCIGKAGERLIPFASIMCDHGRAAGRTGMGAVMGSKLLKAVAVEGREEIPIIWQDGFDAKRRSVNIALKDENISTAFRDYGTSSGVDYMDYLGDMPKYSFTRGVIGDVWKLSGMTMSETILKGKSTCHGCVIGSGRVVDLGDGKRRKGPEYETICGFGPNLGIINLPFITRMGEICDRYGLDTISMANIISLAFLLYNEGILRENEIEGLSLEWGNEDAVEELIHRTVNGSSFGLLLAKGAKALAEHFGVPGYAAQVNGLEVPYHDPRGGSGSGLVYVTSPRGACHMQGDYFWVDTMGRTNDELGIKFFKRHDGAEKSENVVKHQNWSGIFNSLVQCMHASVPVLDMVELINLVTGFDYALQELVLLGERSWNLKRVINLKLGYDVKNEILPEILMKPLPDGGSAGYVPPIEEMLEAYYKARTWDKGTGKPKPEKLREIGLSEYIAEIWK